MKKIRILALVLFSTVIFAGCNKTEKHSEEPVESQEKETVIAEELSVIEEIEQSEIVEEVLTDYTLPEHEIVDAKYYSSKTLRTAMLEDAVIRLMPTENSEALGTVEKGTVVSVTAYDDKKVTFDDTEGYWVKIIDGDEYNGTRTGWIFSKYVNIDKKAEVSILSVSKSNKDGENYSSILLTAERFSSEFDSGNKFIKNVETWVYLHKQADSDFYTFRWCEEMKDFFFTDPVGTFAWYPETNTIEHLSTIGHDLECAYAIVTEDRNYLLEDLGTGPGARGVYVYDLNTNKQIFNGSYYRDMELSDNEITIVKNKYQIASDEESLMYMNDYENTVPLTEEEQAYLNDGLDVQILVRYRYNLVTGDRTYKDCIRIITQ